MEDGLNYGYVDASIKQFAKDENVFDSKSGNEFAFDSEKFA